MDKNEWMVKMWNRTCIRGTEVELINDDGRVEITKTRSEAFGLGSGDPVIQVEGKSGSYSLDRILPCHIII